MFSPSIFLFVVFILGLTWQTAAQNPGVTVGTTPLLTCNLLTFSCPGTGGCCPIGGCCGSRCCPLYYKCINEGTSSQTCCPSSDPTKCGTVKPAVSQLKFKPQF